MSIGVKITFEFIGPEMDEAFEVHPTIEMICDSGKPNFLKLQEAFNEGLARLAAALENDEDEHEESWPT